MSNNYSPTVDLSVLEGRLTATRAGYLDELGPTEMPADLDAVLVDTSTTIPGTISTMQTDVSSILTDTANMQPNIAALMAMRPVVDTYYESFSGSSTSASWFTLASFNVPNEAGAEYAVLCVWGGALTDSTGQTLNHQLHGSVLGNETYTKWWSNPGNQYYNSSYNEVHGTNILGRDGFGPDELVSFQLDSDGTRNIQFSGSAYFEVRQTTQLS